MGRVEFPYIAFLYIRMDHQTIDIVGVKIGEGYPYHPMGVEGRNAFDLEILISGRQDFGRSDVEEFQTLGFL